MRVDQLYRMEASKRRTAAVRFTGKRVRLVLRSPERTLYGRVLAIAAGGQGLQSDVIVLNGSEVGTRADTLPNVLSIEEVS